MIEDHLILEITALTVLYQVAQAGKELLRGFVVSLAVAVELYSLKGNILSHSDYILLL